MTTLICQQVKRREKLRQHQELNGLDYLEVSEDGKSLTVYLLGKAQFELNKTQLIIEGSRRIQGIQVEKIQIQRNESIEFDDYIEVSLDQIGDFSTYTLRVIEQIKQGESNSKSIPHSAFDPRYDRIDFNFKVDCPSELDCKQEIPCIPTPLEEPDINYLAKDYGSFRQLILDRLSLTMPDWNERHIPDIGMALVEVFAYVGDHLSYYQDAVATEAYLGTARKRTSVRRHARLVDYKMHEGCNARAWICINMDTDLPLEVTSKETYFITGFNEALQSIGSVLTEEDLRQIPSSKYEVFESVGDGIIQLYSSHNEINFYSWGDEECCLPIGSTTATLTGELAVDDSSASNEIPNAEPDCSKNNKSMKSNKSLQSSSISSQVNDISNNTSPILHLEQGDVLIFEEVKGSETGHTGDANPKHRHAVRLTSVEKGVDKLNSNSPVVEISWAEQDALSFPLCISSLGLPPHCERLKNISVARGNTILVDHGKIQQDEDLGSVPVAETINCCKGEGVLTNSSKVAGHYQPSLQNIPLTFSQPVISKQAASKVLSQDPRRALPQVVLKTNSEELESVHWLPREDLLSSRQDDQHFVAEVDNDGRASIRFGKGESGKQPVAGSNFKASYRIGYGPAGNVGAEAISHVVSNQLNGATVSVRNPIPAQGGVAPETMEEVKLFAPHTFRKELQRAITAEDYASIVQREFKDKVQCAAAKLRWTGKGYEVLVAIDPYGQEQAGAELLNAISGCLHRYRRMGHEVMVKSAKRVALDIALEVCVLPNYLRGHIKAVLLGLLSHYRLPNGQLGFFHPDNLTFGEGIYLSKIIAVVQAIQGVESVKVTKLQRLNASPNQEIENGILPLGAFEIARLDNDPSFPENGILTLDMRGGR